MRTRTITALAIAALALSPSLALASPITGTFDISNTPGVTVGLLFTNFLCQTGLSASCPAPANYGNFSESGTGDFAALGSGYIHNLSQSTTPAGGGFTLPNFIVFPSAPNIALDLNMIFLGVDSQAGCGAAPAPGQTCTPQSAAFVSASDPSGLSPLNLQNLNGGGSSASFAVAGITRNIATGETSNFNGTFTAQFTTPYQTLLATVLAGGTITNTYSATFTVTAASVPEPGSMFMMLGGLLVAGSVGLRKLSRRG
jgi:hypothetical protein